MLFLNIT